MDNYYGACVQSSWVFAWSRSLLAFAWNFFSSFFRLKVEGRAAVVRTFLLPQTFISFRQNFLFFFLNFYFSFSFLLPCLSHLGTLGLLFCFFFFFRTLHWNFNNKTMPTKANTLDRQADQMLWWCTVGNHSPAPKFPGGAVLSVDSSTHLECHDIRNTEKKIGNNSAMKKDFEFVFPAKDSRSHKL